MITEIVLGFLVTLLSMLLVMPKFISYLKSLGMSQEVSEYALEEYKAKAKTPIMGGLLFVIIPVIVFVFIERNRLDSRILLVLCSYLAFCFVGFLDDFMIILRHNNKGLSPLSKIIMEVIIVAGVYFLFGRDVPSQIDLPFTDKTIFPYGLGIFFLPFMLVMYLGEANAVNFTDGMDGLCAGVSAIVTVGFMILCYNQNEMELLVLLATVLGGLIGYLVFNFHPAKIFMGDSGSLALGALFSSVALLLQKELILLIIGGVFLVEMACVVIQQLSVRLFHKRVFKYTPIHYAFVLKGYKETNIVLVFYLVTLVLTVIGVYLGLH